MYLYLTIGTMSIPILRMLLSLLLFFKSDSMS